MIISHLSFVAAEERISKEEVAPCSFKGASENAKP